MSEREEALKARVRETPLVDRLQDCRKRVGDMCAERRGPRMSIPPEHYDDDFYICVTVEDARERIAAIDSQLAEADNARKHAQEVGSKLVEEVRALKRLNEIERVSVMTMARFMRRNETVESVTEWANETFGEATIEAQLKRAEKEIRELLDATDPAKIAEESADVCICLFRIIGTLNPEAINLKMEQNRARTWKLDGNGCAQHVKEPS